jgi:hypothetical protein
MKKRIVTVVAFATLSASVVFGQAPTAPPTAPTTAQVVANLVQRLTGRTSERADRLGECARVVDEVYMPQKDEIEALCKATIRTGS